MLTKLGIGWMIGPLLVACQWWYYLLETKNYRMTCICGLLYWILLSFWMWDPFHIFVNKENNHDCL